MSNSVSPLTKEEFLQHCIELAEVIKVRQKELVKILLQYETYETAQDEITRSIDALKGARVELEKIDNPLEGLSVSTFFPLNLPLYSLIIFGILPSAFADHAYIRPPEVMYGMLSKLWRVLSITQNFPALSLNSSPRHIFVDLYASESDVIIFTGKYENALDIHKHCPDSLLIYNGSGVNPFLLFENADVDLAVAKAVEMRCFNSGQDCAGPDAFFVPKSLADEFTSKLKTALESIKVGDTTDPEVRVGRTMKQTYITELEQWFNEERGNLIFGGQIDKERHLVYPTIIRKKITEHTGNEFHEFFAPFFYVLEYANVGELESILGSPAFYEHTMYVSVFGQNPTVEATLKTAKILRNVIVNDVEHGNEEYGGYGAKSNFLLYGTQKIVQPILINRDIHAMLGHAKLPASQLIG